MLEGIELWGMNHPGKKFLDDIPIHAFVDKDTLLDYLVLECGCMKTIEQMSELLHFRVKMFFATHKWNIDKLCESLQYEYEPLENYHGTEERIVQRDVEVDTVRDRDQTNESVTDRDQTTDTSNKKDLVDNEHTEKTWSENGSNNETDVHFMSAYNDKESPEQIGTDANGRPIYKYNDTEQYRDAIDASYDKEGRDGTQRDLVQNVTDTKNEKVAEDTVINDVLAEDIRDNEVTDEDIVETKNKSGNTGISYQSLIEEERRQAQFNIYKWIMNHWMREIVVAIW